MSSSYCNHIKRAFFSWNKEVMIHKRHNYSMQCRQDAAERGIFFMHKRLLLQVFYTVIKFLWMRRLDWIFFGLLGGVWKARYLAQSLYNFGICQRLGRKVHSVWFPFLLCVVLCYLNSLEFNWITPSLYLYENQAQKFLAESSRTPECML